MQALAIGAGVAIILGVTLLFLLRGESRGRGRAEAETAHEKQNKKNREARDERLAVPVADEATWLRRARDRLKRVRDEQQ